MLKRSGDALNGAPDRQAENVNGVAALWYAARLDWAVVPLHTPTGDRERPCSCNRRGCDSIGKHPRTLDWVKGATTDPDTIRRWWSMWPDANVGIATGAVSGFIALDVDVAGEDGEDSLAKLQLTHGDMPVTTTSITQSGGRHFLFQPPAGIRVPNKVKFAPGLDIRGDGGLIAVAPSIGARGGYRWLNGRGPDVLRPVPTPGWLLKIIAPAGNGKSTPADEWRALIENGAGEGARNASVARLAGMLLRQGVGLPSALAFLHLWNSQRCRPPLDPSEVETTVASIHRSEEKRRGIR